MVCSRSGWQGLFPRLCVAVCCSVLQCGAVLQFVTFVAVCCGVLQQAQEGCALVQAGKVSFNICVLQYVSVRCSVLQCAKVRCSVLQL